MAQRNRLFARRAAAFGLQFALIAASWLALPASPAAAATACSSFTDTKPGGGAGYTGLGSLVVAPDGRLTMAYSNIGGTPTVLVFDPPNGPVATSPHLTVSTDAAQGGAFDPQGTFWYVSPAGDAVGRVSESPFADLGAISPALDGGSMPVAVVRGPDGMYVTLQGSNQIARIDPVSFAPTFWTVPTANAGLGAIAVGPDGALWFSEDAAHRLGRLDPTVADPNLAITEFALSSGATAFANAGSQLWFAESNGSSFIGHIAMGDPQALAVETPLPAGTKPQGIALGIDGALWFTDDVSSPSGRIGRLVPGTGALTFPLSVGLQNPTDIQSVGNTFYFNQASKGSITTFQIDAQGNVLDGHVTITPVGPSSTATNPISYATTTTLHVAVWTLGSCGVTITLTLKLADGTVVTSTTTTGTTADLSFPYDNATWSVGIVVTENGSTVGLPFYDNAVQTNNTLLGIAALIVLPTSLPGGVTGTPYSQQITAQGGTAPFTFSAVGTLPPGLTLSAAGLLAGTPTTTGTYAFTVTAKDAGGLSGSRSYSVPISAPLTLSPSTLPGGAVGTAYSQTFTTTGGTAPVSFAATGLPSWLVLDGATGVLSGTPTAAGTFTFSVTAKDANGATVTRSYSIAVTSVQNATPITVAPTSLPSGSVGTSYSQTFTASGGSGGPYTFSVDPRGNLDGLTLSSAGVLSGAPSAAGTFNFSVRATDATGASGAQSYNLVVSRPQTASACVLALEPKSDGLEVSGRGGLIVRCGAITVDSADPSDAIKVSGESSLVAAAVNVVGGVKKDGKGTISPAPTHTAPVADPLAALSTPAAGTTQRTDKLHVDGKTAVTLAPGVYNGGIEIAGDAKVTFAPGVYVIRGGGLHIGGNATVTGSGVLFALAGKNGDGKECGEFEIDGKGAVSLSAARSGQYGGILLFDRCEKSEVEVTGNGGSLFLSGTLYAPNTEIEIHGKMPLTLNTPLIGRTIEVGGEGTVTIANPQ